MSQKHHKKQVERARQQRRATAAEAKQQRVRVIAIVLVAALALSLFAAAIFAGGGTSPEVASTPDGDQQAFATDDPTTTEPATGEATDPAGTEDPAVTPSDDPAAADAGEGTYLAPQGADAEPCPTDAEAPEPTATPYDSAPEMTIDPAATYVATIGTTCGEIVLELAAGEAPATVNNFVFLAEDGYYDGVPFHRVIDGFMIQGGDPSGTGHGNQGEFPGYTFEDELAYAEQVVAAEGGYPRGTLAMANAGPDTNGSQFFIVQASPGYALPPDYTMFGSVREGMDVVDRIAQGPAQGDLAIDPVRILGITIEQTGTDAG